MAAGPHIPITPKAVVAGLLASLAAAALVVVAMALLGEYTKTRGRLLLTALSLAGFCLLALAPSALAQRDRYAALGVGGLAAACLGFFLVAAGTWATPAADAYWKATGIVSIGAVSGAHLCWLLLLGPRRLPARTAWWTAVVAASLVPVLTGVAIIVEIKAAPFWWVVSLVVIAQVGGGIAAPALNHLGFPRLRLPHWRARNLGPSGEDQG